MRDPKLAHILVYLDDSRDPFYHIIGTLTYFP